MKTLCKKIFLINWQRKSIALLLGMVIWLTVNHSLTSTKVINNVPVKVINLPVGKTIEGMQNNGRLGRKLNLTVIGNTNTLKDLNANDLEIVIDALGRSDEWIASISKKNLVSLNPEVDVNKGISKVFYPSFILRMTKLVTEKIPVIVTRPIGEAPRGYEFLDVWPYTLSLTVSGPEDVIRRLQTKEQKITFNLNDISKAQLDALSISQSSEKSDVVSFFIPDQWKQIYIPLLSDTPLELDEVTDQTLRIDFLCHHLIPLESPIFISLFYPPEYESIYNPVTLKIKPNTLVREQHEIFTIRPLLYAKGSDRLFTQIIKNRVQITIVASPLSQRTFLEWGLQFINPIQLEDQYVSTLMSDASDENIRIMKPSIREEYLRNRFRSYMNRFRLFTADDTKFELNARIEGNNVEIEETKSSQSDLRK
ncbi:MAG: hypothetical protein V4489_02245 [Chlamydiota bacterium]